VSVKILDPDPDALAIARLWLERLPMFTREERLTAHLLVQLVMNPPVLVPPDAR
jgi:hypothetical protein